LQSTNNPNFNSSDVGALNFSHNPVYAPNGFRDKNKDEVLTRLNSASNSND